MRTTFYTQTGERPQGISPVSSLAPPRTSAYLIFLRAAALILLLFVVAPAQIRLHDPANEELAKKTRDTFADFSKADDNVFETMISNTLTLKAATLAHLYELNRQSRQDTINVIPVKSWERLLDDVTKTQQDFRVAYNSARRILEPSSQSAADMKSALALAKAQAKDLADEKARKKAALEAAVPKLEDLKKSLESLRDSVAASAKPVKKLADLAAFQNLKSVWKDVSAVKSWLDEAEKASDAPGLQLLILELGVRNQQFQVDRLALELEEAEANEEVATRVEQRLKLVWGDGTVDVDQRATDGIFKKIYDNIKPCPQGGPCPLTDQCRPGSLCSEPFVTVENQSQQVLHTIGVLATTAEGEVGKPLKATLQLRDLLDVLNRYVSVVGYHKYLLLADVIEAGANKHLFSIRRSALNTKNREMLVSHGLEGLAAYHAGGLKPEEIANFFRAAQSIAIGVLAGRGR